MRFVSFLGSSVLVVAASAVPIACSGDEPREFGPGEGEAGASSAQGGSAQGGSAPSAGADSTEAGSPPAQGGTSNGGAGGSVPSGGTETAAGGAGEQGGAESAAGAAGAQGLEPRTLPCEASMREDFPLVGGKVSTGVVTNQASGGGFVSQVDATAGGFANAALNPWVYLKVTRAGLQKVDIDDEQALKSLDWDVAAKRFSIRLNGGDGGPSIVTAAVLTGTAYGSVTAVPAAASFAADSFYDDECVLQQNDAGVGAPSLRLDAYFLYQGCSMMTATPFVLELANGEHVKLEVTSFYATGQDVCNSDGEAGTLAGTFTWRWQYL